MVPGVPNTNERSSYTIVFVGGKGADFAGMEPTSSPTNGGECYSVPDEKVRKARQA